MTKLPTDTVTLHVERSPLACPSLTWESATSYVTSRERDRMGWAVEPIGEDDSIATYLAWDRESRLPAGRAVRPPGASMWRAVVPCATPAVVQAETEDEARAAVERTFRAWWESGCLAAAIPEPRDVRGPLVPAAQVVGNDAKSDRARAIRAELALKELTAAARRVLDLHPPTIGALAGALDDLRRLVR